MNTDTRLDEAMEMILRMFEKADTDDIHTRLLYLSVAAGLAQAQQCKRIADTLEAIEKAVAEIAFRNTPPAP